MYKKIIAGILILAVVALGSWKLFFAGKKKTSDVIKEITNNTEAYYMEATMEMINGEDSRNFNVSVSYQNKDGKDHFRISLLDNNINQEQILLRNEDGVYVLTPTLNQVYKFSSDWPLNSHKPYLYHSIVDAVKKSGKVKNLNDGYLITTTAEYKNSPTWVSQEVKFSKDLNPVYVHILDKDNQVVVNVEFTKVDFEPSFADDLFIVNNNMSQAREEMTQGVTSKLEDLPLLPAGADISTTLKESTKATVNGTTTFILTYKGDVNFTITQKMATIEKEMAVVEVAGEVVDLINGFGVYNDGLLSYIYNGVEYNIYASDLPISTLIEVANGMEVVAIK